MEAKIVQCPNCSKKMKIPPTHFGKKIKCPQCSSVLQISDKGEVSLAGASQKQPAAKATKQPPAQAGKAAAKKASAAKGKAKAELRPASAVATKKEPKLKEGVKIAGAGKKGKLKVAKTIKEKKPKGVRIGDKQKAVGLSKRSAASRLQMIEKTGSSKIYTTLGIILGVIAIGSIVLYFLTQKTPENTSSKIPGEKELIPEVKFLEEGSEEEFDDYNNKPRKMQKYKRTSRIEIYIAAAKGEEKEKRKFINELEFVKIPAGTYKIGNPNDPEGKHGEGPELEVKVDEFYISRKEVTTKAYHNFVNHLDQLRRWREKLLNEAKVWINREPDYAKASLERASKLDDKIFSHPDEPLSNSHTLDIELKNNQAVYGISWWSAYAYCAWANGLDPTKGNLPTEIEWEIAARGPDMNLYPWGKKRSELKAKKDEEITDIIKNFGYFAGIGKSYNPDIDPDAEEYYKPKPNGFGIYDMTGNVAEWCWGTWCKKIYLYMKENKTDDKMKFYFDELDDKEKIDKYRVKPDSFTVRGSMCSYEGKEELLDKLRFTSDIVRQHYKPDIAWKKFPIGFRCIYYDKDHPGATVEILKELYDKRKKMQEEAAKKFVEVMLAKIKKAEGITDEK